MNNYFYEIHVAGKHGFSVAIAVEEELFEEQEVIDKAIELNKLELEDSYYVDYTDNLTEKEYNEHFNF